MDNFPTFEVVVGTYEEYLLGYKLSPNDKGIEMIQSFATHAHTSSVRCVSSSGKYLASGGADDRIVVYDMKTRKEHCMLNTHNATITSIKFTIGNSHIISGCNDGILAIVRVGNWQLEKIWDKSHKGAAVLDIAVHPTGKLALTLGADYTLRTWNLIKGRQAYAINLTTKSTDFKSLDSVKWSPCGENFILSGGLHLEFWNITTGGIINKYQFKSRVTSTCWIKEKYVAIGHEDGQITILNVKKEKQNVYPAHSMRVKCLDSSKNWLVSASSDGHIKIWDYNKKKLIQIADTSTGCRCTCLTLVSTIELKEEKHTNEKQNEVCEEENDADTENSVVEKETQKVTKNKQKDVVKIKKGYRVVIEEDNTDETVKKKGKKRKNINKSLKSKKNKS